MAPRLDSSAERIVNYLAERHEFNINAVFFRYAKTAKGDEVLIRTVLVPDTVRGVSSARATVTEAELLKMADDHNTRNLVEIFRRLSSAAGEEVASTYKGSFRYWLRGRLILGVNVSGSRSGKNKPPSGELDVWLPAHERLSEIISVPGQEIEETLRQKFNVIEAGDWDYVIRIRTPEQAETLVEVFQHWIKSPTIVTARAS